ncbi:MAG: hypothetical protein JNL87_03920 [Burkholderiaceae bacterium]|nr:hypothetical protein [Burkholderiaceae bacterium]
MAGTAQVDRDDAGTPNVGHRDSPTGGCATATRRAARPARREGGIDPGTGVDRSEPCSRDCIELRDAGFPVCGPGGCA